MFSTQIGNHLFIGKLTQARNPHIDIYLIDGQQNAQRVLGKDFTLKEWGEFVAFMQRLVEATHREHKD